MFFFILKRGRNQYLEERLRGVGEEDVEGKEILDWLLGQATLGTVAPHLGQVLLPPGQHLVQVEVPAHQHEYKVSKM